MNIITFQAVSKNGLLLSVDRQHKYNEASEINKNIDGLHGAHAAGWPTCTQELRVPHTRAHPSLPVRVGPGLPARGVQGAQGSAHWWPPLSTLPRLPLVPRGLEKAEPSAQMRRRRAEGGPRHETGHRGCRACVKWVSGCGCGWREQSPKMLSASPPGESVPSALRPGCWPAVAINLPARGRSARQAAVFGGAGTSRERWGSCGGGVVGWGQRLRRSDIKPAGDRMT